MHRASSKRCSTLNCLKNFSRRMNFSMANTCRRRLLSGSSFFCKILMKSDFCFSKARCWAFTSIIAALNAGVVASSVDIDLLFLLGLNCGHDNSNDKAKLEEMNKICVHYKLFVYKWDLSRNTIPVRVKVNTVSTIIHQKRHCWTILLANGYH